MIPQNPEIQTRKLRLTSLESIFQEGYKTLFEIGGLNELEDMKRIKEVTDIVAKLPEEAVQKKYAFFISSGYTYPLELLIFSTAIKPNEDIVHKGYNAYLKEGKITELKELVRITNIKLILLERDVQKAYLNYALSDDLDKLMLLYEITEIVPNLPQEKIQEIYVNYIKKEHLDRLIKFQEITNVPPNLPENVIQKYYSLKIGGKDLDSINKLVQITKIKPNEDSILEGYAIYLHSKFISDLRNPNPLNINLLYEIEEVTGIHITNKIVQDAYIKYLLYSNTDQVYIDAFKRLKEIINIEPSNEMIQSVYSFCVNQGLIDKLRTINQLTRIEPILSNDIVQRCYAFCIQTERFEDFKLLKRMTKINPSFLDLSQPVSDITLKEIHEPEDSTLKALYNLLHRRDPKGRIWLASPTELAQMIGLVKLDTNGDKGRRYTETDKTFLKDVVGYLHNPNTLMYGAVKGSDIAGKYAPMLVYRFEEKIS